MCTLREGREALERIGRQRIVLKDPGRFTPFAFPILVDRLREKLTSEQLEDRIRKMTEHLEQGIRPRSAKTSGAKRK